MAARWPFAPRALALILHGTNRHEESVAVKREERAGVQRSVGAEHPLVAGSLDNLGYELLWVKRDDEAETVLLEALRQVRKFYPGHKTARAHIYGSLLRIPRSARIGTDSSSSRAISWRKRKARSRPTRAMCAPRAQRSPAP